MNRRHLLGLLAATTAAAGAGVATPWRRPMSRMPAIFLAHGAPPLLDDAEWVAQLAAWAAALPRPKAILVVSAHWEADPVTLGATRTVPLIYDFYGFPDRYYRQRYAAPGAPALAERVKGLLADAGVASADAPDRGLDHGAYVPLVAMYPKADIPVLQVSMPTLWPTELFEIGRKLAPLRDEGVLIVASGFLTHNLGAMGGGLPPWAIDFDAWTAETLAGHDHDALQDFQRRAPGVRFAHPRTEHFVPVLVAAGAGADDPVTFPITGWWLGPFTKRSVQYG